LQLGDEMSLENTVVVRLIHPVNIVNKIINFGNQNFTNETMLQQEYMNLLETGMIMAVMIITNDENYVDETIKIISEDMVSTMMHCGVLCMDIGDMAKKSKERIKFYNDSNKPQQAGLQIFKEAFLWKRMIEEKIEIKKEILQNETDIDGFRAYYWFLPSKQNVFIDRHLLIKKFQTDIMNGNKPIMKRSPIESRLRHECFKRDGYRCLECGKTNEETTLHCDHILPVSQGGTDELSNLQTLCDACNLAKSDKCWESDCG
jgi:hypothetical protein